MVEENIKCLEKSDAEIADAIRKEYNRQSGNIELIASENIVSEEVLLAAGSILTNKYAEGYPGRRYYGGCECVDIVEEICIERVKKLFGAEFANVQPHSGAQANYAVYQALCKPGDTVMGMALDQGGHLTHGSSVNFSGKLYNMVSYGVDENGFIDYDEVLKIAKECRPQMIIAGASAYPRFIDYKKFREIADEVGAYLMVDMAHVAGLVAAGVHPSPVPYAHVTTTTTHKTLRGPRGGVILSNDPEIAKKINSAIFPGSQGGPLMHIIAAKAVAFGEALKPSFVEYQKQVVKNAKALADAILGEGVKLVSGGTDNHLMLLDLRGIKGSDGEDLTGKILEKNLDEVHITANKNTVPFDPQGPTKTSGLRLGTPAVTTRGFNEDDMKIVGKLVANTIFDFEGTKEDTLAQVQTLCEKYPIYK